MYIYIYIERERKREKGTDGPASAPSRRPPPVPRKVDVRLPEKGNSNSHGASYHHDDIVVL